MYDGLVKTEMGLCVIVLLLAWMAGAKASRLMNSGSAERLHRKTRKLIFRLGIVSLPALALLLCIGWMTAALPSPLWEDRVLLHGPLIGAPLLAVWFITLPKLWHLWRETSRSPGILDHWIRCSLAAPGIVLPFQATAIGAATVMYYASVQSVSYEPLKAVIPLLLNLCAVAGLWALHDRRWRHLAYAGPIARRRAWHRALRHMGIL